MVVVPAGEFMMGDLDGSGNRNENPAHRVTISQAFAVSKYEITFAQWDACVDAGGCTHISNDRWGRLASFRGGGGGTLTLRSAGGGFLNPQPQ